MSAKNTCDVIAIVIGGGSSAIEAAISARQAGAESVVMIEKAPKHESGGVDTQARVINTCYEPIKGLYASGDIIGLFFHNYPSCTGQTRNAVFRYLAGRGAGAMLAKN